MNDNLHTLPRGGWPVMLTPYRDDLSLDEAGVDNYTNWLIERGAAGLFAVALSAEMYHLTDLERDRLARQVIARADHRVPVVVGSPTGGSAAEQADAVARVAATGADAVVLITSQLAPPDASDGDVVNVLETIVERNPGVALGAYECPLPFKRLLSLPVIEAMSQTGAFVFLKDTSHSVPVMASRLQALSGSRMQLFNAAIGSLTPSLAAGASGLSGYVANIYPDLVEWLCQNFAHPDAKAVQRLLTVVEHSINLRYPSSAKYLLSHSSTVPMRAISRWKPEIIGAHEGLPLEHLADYIRDLDLPPGALHPQR